MIILLIKSVLIGVAIAAPVGPIAILCISRTLKNGLIAGIITGLGVAIADAIYGAVSGFGLTLVSNFLASHQFVIRIIGGLFLCYLGMKIILTATTPTIITDNNRSLMREFTSAIILTLTNPMTILTFITVFASLGIGSTDSGYGHASMVVLGIFIGSFIWWITLSAICAIMSHKIKIKTMTWINRISGLIIVAFGVLAII